MRCKACNRALEDRDLVRKDRETGEFLDLCGECLVVSNDAISYFHGWDEWSSEGSMVVPEPTEGDNEDT
jgi:hypothetical protein